MHYIQRYILGILMHEEFARFRDMRPPRVDSNVYSYHLRRLQKEHYIVNASEGYTLDTKGLILVDELRDDNLGFAPQPKLIVILALTDGSDNWLLAQRKTQPYIGKLMFTSGKQHRGETKSEHVSREMKEKIGFVGINMTFRGVVDTQISSSTGELLTHIVGNVYEGVIEKGYLPPETSRYKFVWHNFETENNTGVSLSGDTTLYKALRQPNPIDLIIKSSVD